MAASKKRPTAEVIEERRQEIMKRFAKALEALDDVPRLKAMHEEHERRYQEYRASYGEECPPFGPSKVLTAMNNLVMLAEELSALIWTQVDGLPITTACICQKCKAIILKYPTKGYYCRDCGRSYMTQGRYDRGLGLGFWDRYNPGDKFQGKLETDLEEGHDGRGKGANG